MISTNCHQRSEIERVVRWTLLFRIIVSPIFLPRAPDRNPRTECACQPVAFLSSFRVAPPERLSRSRTLAVLLPGRALAAFLADLADVAPALAFFAGLALWPDLALAGATCALCAATRGFWVGFGRSGPWSAHPEANSGPDRCRWAQIVGICKKSGWLWGARRPLTAPHEVCRKPCPNGSDQSKSAPRTPKQRKNRTRTARTTRNALNNYTFFRYG